MFTFEYSTNPFGSNMTIEGTKTIINTIGVKNKEPQTFAKRLTFFLYDIHLKKR
jgi:hypothetical protein